MSASSGPEGETIEILTAANHWLSAGDAVALATVTATWGSSPRPVGSLLAVNAKGDFVGSVSGGCVEGAVIATAADVMQSGQPQQLEFGVSDEQAWDVGLACGGTVKVYLEKLQQGAIAPLLAAIGERQAMARLMRLETGEAALYPMGQDPAAGELGAVYGQAAQQALADNRSGLIQIDGHSAFVRVFTPAPRMIIIGAVHIAQYLASVASLAGFAVTVVDPRQAFATAERFPQTTLLDQWPDKALEHLGLDAHTAVVTLTHDAKLDEPALMAALRSPAFYVGALGSKKTHAARLQRLQAAGLSEAQLRRIRAPIGLDLGGRSPAEIAIAIAAEAIQLWHRPERGLEV